MRILERVREAGGAHVSWEALRSISDRFLDDLDALEAFGFRLERHPIRGVAYWGPADRLCPDQIEHRLDILRIGRRIAVWNRASSTNDLAVRAAASSANDGLVVLAEEQTAGRGQRGRVWSAPARSSILMSVVIFPPEHLVPYRPEAETLDGRGWLTALGAVAVAEVVSTWTGREARIKWPNDVRVDGRKVAGILVERARPISSSSLAGSETDSGAGGCGAIIGIGLNANLVLEDFPAELRDASTSLRLLRDGEPVDRSELARDLIRRLDGLYDLGQTVGSESLSPYWRDRCEHLGQGVRVTTPAGPVVGRLVDLDVRHGLTLDPADSALDPIRIPLVEILRLEGNVELAGPGC